MLKIMLTIFAYVWYSIFIMEDKRYYIKDILEILGVAKNTFHNWEREGKVPKANRDPMNNYRYWTEEDIKLLKKVTGRGE